MYSVDVLEQDELRSDRQIGIFGSSRSGGCGDQVVSGAVDYFGFEQIFSETRSLGIPMTVMVVAVENYTELEQQCASSIDFNHLIAANLSSSFGTDACVAALGGDEFALLLRGVHHYPEILQIHNYAQLRLRENPADSALAGLTFKAGIARSPLDDECLRTLLVLAGRAVDELEADAPDFQFVDGRHRRSLSN